MLNQTTQQVSQNTSDIAHLSQGWKLQSDGDAASSVLAGDTVQINSGKNIDVSRNGNTLTIATADDLNLNSVTLQDASGNNSVLTGSGLNVSNSAGNSAQYGADSLVFNPDTANAVSIGNAGINAGNQKITNVADGAISSSSKDAINGSQLYNIQQEVQEHIKKAEDEAGLLGSLAVQYDSTDKNHITLGGAGASNAVGISNVADGNIAAGSSDAVTGNQLFQPNTQVNQNTNDIAHLSQGWKLQSDGDNASAVLAGDTVQINSGNNIDVSRVGNTLTIATAADLTLNSVTLQDASGNSSVINGNQLVFNPNTANAVSIGNTGVNAGNQTITNVADGAISSSSKEAINGSQLYDIQQEMQEHIKKAEDEAGLLGSLAVQYDSTDKNHITLGGVGAANAVGISNLADGKVEVGSKDAVNGGQLYAVDQKVDQNSADIAHLSQGWRIQSDGDTASSVVAGDTVQFNSGKNIDVSRDGNTLTIATADDLNLNSVSLQDASGTTYGVLDASGLNVSNSSGSEAHYGADQLVFNPGSANAVSVGETGISAGNQTISNVAAGDISSATSTDAVNGGQLYQTNQNIADNKNAIDQLSQGWKLQSDGDVDSSVKAGDTVQINSGNNIDISRVGNTLTIATSDDMVLTSVTTVDGSGKSSILDAGGLQVDSGNGAWASYGAGSSIINDGQGNQTSTNASGTEVQDAAGNTTQVNSKGMVLLNKDGTQLASLNQQQLSFSNGTPGSNVSIGLNGISAGNQKVTNVADGTVGVGSKDAVNGGQLYQTNQNVTNLDNKVADLSQGWNLQSDGDNASAVRAGDTVAINSGKNIDVNRVGNEITINTSDDLVVNSVVAQDADGNTMTLNAEGLVLQDALGNVNVQTASSNILVSNNYSNVTTAMGSNLSDGDNTAQYLVGGTILTNKDGEVTHVTADGMTAFDKNGNTTDYSSNGLVINNAGNTITISNGNINFGGNTLTNVAAGVTAGDAVNKGQLDQVGNSIANALGGSSSYDAATGTVNAGLAVGGTTFNTVQAALDAVNQQANAGWKVSTENGSTYTVAPNDTVDFSNNDGNVVLKNTNGDITVDLAKDVNLGSVTVDDGLGNQTVLNGAGTEVTDALGNNATYGANGVSIADAAGNQTTDIGAGNINVAGNTYNIAIDGNTGEITGLGNTTYDPNNIQADRAATEGQIADLDQQLTNKGFNISANGGAGDTVKLGETVDFSNSDGNIEISNNVDNGIQFKLANAISVQSVTADDGQGNKTVLNTAGTQVEDAQGNSASYGANGISISSAAGNTITIADGNVNFGGNTLSGVGAGVNADDAINKGQLDNLGNNLADNFGGNAQYDGNTITWSNIGGTGANTVDSAIASVNDKVNLGWNAADTAGNTFNVAAGQTVGFVNNDGNINITAAGSSLTFDLANDINVNSVTADDGQGNKTVLNTAGTQVEDAQGNSASYGANGISISSAAGNTITIADSNVNFGGNTLSGVGAGVNADDAINKGQLDNLGNNLADNIFGGNAQYDGNTITWSNIGGTGANTVDSAIASVNDKVNLGWNAADTAGNTFNVAAGQTVGFVNNDGNININAAGSSLTFDLASDINVNSVTADDGQGNKTVLNTAGTQVEDAQGNSATYGANGISISSAAGNTITIADGNVNFSGNTLSGVGAGVNADDAVNKGQLDNLGNNLADNIFGGNAQYDGNTITWSNIGGTGANTVDSAIASVNDKVNLGWNAADTAGNTFNVAAGQTVGFVNTDGNINITAAGSSLTFDLANDINVNSVTADDGQGNKTVLNTAGTQVEDAQGNSASYGANGISISSAAGNTITIADGNVNFGGNTLSGVGAGVNADDAVNKGQLDNLGNNLADNIFGGNAQYDGNTITWSNIGGTGANTVDSAIASVNDKVNLGWNAADTAGNTFNVAAGQTVGFVNNDGNINITAAGSSLTFDLANDINVNSVTADDGQGNKTVLNTAGTQVSDALGNKASYGANGSSFTDFAGNNNISNALGNSLTDIAGNTYSTTAAGSVLTNTAGDKTELTAAGTQVSDALGNNASYGANGISISSAAGNTITIADGNVNFGGNTLSGVGAGVNADDAVNKGQLDNLGNNLADNIFGGNAQYDGNTITWSNIGGTGANTVDDAITTVNSKLNLGWNAADTAGNTFNVAAGQTVGFVNTDGNINITAAGSSLTFDLANDINVNSVTADDGQGNKTVLNTAGTQVSDALGNKASYGANGSSFTDLAGNSNISNALGNSLNDIAGNTYSTTAAGSNLTNAAGDTYATTATGSVLTNTAGDKTELTAAGTQVADALGNNASYGANGISIADAAGNVFTNIGAGNINVAGNTYNIAIDGNTGEITGLSNTKYDPNNIQADRAATEGQIADLDQQLTNKGFNISANGGAGDTVKLGETVDFTNSDGNIEISNNVDNGIQFKLANAISVQSVTADDGQGNKTVLNTAGTQVEDAQGNKASYGANGSSFIDLAGNSNISNALGNTLTDIAGNTYSTNAAGSVLTNAAGDKTELTAAGTQVADALGNNATYGANGISIAEAAGNVSTSIGAGNINVAGNTYNIAIDGNSGEITGLSNTKYDPNNIQADRAATEGQIADLDNKINNAGFNISAQGGAGDTVTVGETVDFASADGNLTVSNDVDNQILLTLSSDLNLSSVTMQDALGNVNYVDATGSRVQDALGNNAFYGAIGNQFTDKAGNSFNSSAAGSNISNAKGDVTNVTASGTQVSDAAGNNANYGATGNTITNAAGDSTNVSAGNITVSNGKGGSVSIGGSGIDAGGNQITNVADGTAAGDAINKGQLDQAISDVNNSIGAANNSGVQYDKNADGTVNKDSITLGGGANGTTITNVADGKVEAGSKDAINGGQLHDALQQMQDNQTNINNDILGITVGPDGKPKLDLDIYDVANQTKTGDLTLTEAINTVNQEGTKYAHTNAADESEEPGLLNKDNNSASAGGKNSSAFGVNAIVDDSATNGLAMGYQSKVGEGATDSVSVGSKTEANGKSSVAMGHGSKANGDNSISIGTGNEVNGDRSGAIGDPSIINGNDSYSIGNNNKIDADNSFVLGNEVSIGKDATDMSKANGATFGGSVGLGNGSSVDAAVGTKNITIGDTTYDFAGSAPVGTISVGSKDAERTITNVAAGRIDASSTDAINGSQLYATNQAVDSLIKGESGPVQYVKDGNGKAQNVLNLKGDADSDAPVTLSNVADGKAANDAVNLGQMQKMGDKINARIDGLEDESRAGVATALAVANLPQVYLPGKSGLAIATGVHKGEVGYALGYSSISEGGNWVFKASATANRMGDVGGGAGLLYMFD